MNQKTLAGVSSTTSEVLCRWTPVPLTCRLLTRLALRDGSTSIESSLVFVSLEPQVGPHIQSVSLFCKRPSTVEEQGSHNPRRGAHQISRDKDTRLGHTLPRSYERRKRDNGELFPGTGGQ